MPLAHNTPPRANRDLKQIKDAPTEGTMFVQEKALKFCKQQELQKAMDNFEMIKALIENEPVS